MHRLQTLAFERSKALIMPGWRVLRSAAIGMILCTAAMASSHAEEGYASTSSSSTYAPHFPGAIERERRFTPDEFTVWGAAQTLPVQIFGNPFALEQGAFESVVLERAQTRYWGMYRLKPSLTFVSATPSEADQPRLVLAFDDAEASAAEICAKPAPALAAADPERIRIRAALCRDGTLLAAAYSAVLRDEEGPDYAFEKRLSRTVAALFPYRDLRPYVVAFPTSNQSRYGLHRLSHSGIRLHFHLHRSRHR